MIIRPNTPKWPDAKWAVIYAAGKSLIHLITEDGEDVEVKGNDIKRLFESKLSNRKRWCVVTAAHYRHLSKCLGSQDYWEAHMYKRSLTRMVAYDYNGPTFPMTIYYMPSLKYETPDTIPSGMNAYTEWARRYAGTIGKPSYIGSHTLYRTMPHDLNLTVQSKPIDAMYGGRKEAYNKGRHNDIYHVDMVAAYPWALSEVTIPTIIGQVSSSILDLNRDGVVRATVNIPEDAIPYPLPYRIPGGLVWGYGDKVTGNWTTVDMRTLLRAGGSIDKIHSAWVHRGKRPGLFDDWLRSAVVAARDIDDDLGRRLAKKATNLVWSMFGMRGEIAAYRFHKGNLKPTGQGYKATPMAPSICAVVSAKVRDRIYDYLPSAHFVDTDGVITNTNGLPNTDRPGMVRTKYSAPKIDIFGPQAYRYYDGKEWRYKVAGMRPTTAEMLYNKGVPIGDMIRDDVEWSQIGFTPGNVHTMEAHRILREMLRAEAIHG